MEKSEFCHEIINNSVASIYAANLVSGLDDDQAMQCDTPCTRNFLVWWWTLSEIAVSLQEQSPKPLSQADSAPIEMGYLYTTLPWVCIEDICRTTSLPSALKDRLGSLGNKPDFRIIQQVKTPAHGDLVHVAKQGILSLVLSTECIEKRLRNLEFGIDNENATETFYDVDFKIGATLGIEGGIMWFAPEEHLGRSVDNHSADSIRDILGLVHHEQPSNGTMNTSRLVAFRFNFRKPGIEGRPTAMDGVGRRYKHPPELAFPPPDEWGQAAHLGKLASHNKTNVAGAPERVVFSPIAPDEISLISITRYGPLQSTRGEKESLDSDENFFSLLLSLQSYSKHRLVQELYQLLGITGKTVLS